MNRHDRIRHGRKIRRLSGLLIRLPRRLNRAVQLRPRLALILGLVRVPDGAEPVRVVPPCE